jgi:hypothetical protein
MGHADLRSPQPRNGADNESKGRVKPPDLTVSNALENSVVFNKIGRSESRLTEKPLHPFPLVGHEETLFDGRAPTSPLACTSPPGAVGLSKAGTPLGYSS